MHALPAGVAMPASPGTRNPARASGVHMGLPERAPGTAAARRLPLLAARYGGTAPPVPEPEPAGGGCRESGPDALRLRGETRKNHGRNRVRQINREPHRVAPPSGPLF
jgi:hypothetical protein